MVMLIRLRLLSDNGSRASRTADNKDSILVLRDQKISDLSEQHLMETAKIGRYCCA
jgi:hypothetical protein